MSAHVFVFIEMILILPEKYIVHLSSKRRHTKVVVESGGIGENAGSGSCGVNSSNWRCITGPPQLVNAISPELGRVAHFGAPESLHLHHRAILYQVRGSSDRRNVGCRANTLTLRYAKSV